MTTNVSPLAHVEGDVAHTDGAASRLLHLLAGCAAPGHLDCLVGLSTKDFPDVLDRQAYVAGHSPFVTATSVMYQRPFPAAIVGRRALGEP